MGDENILSAGMDELNDIRRNIREHAEQKEKDAELASQKALLEKEIQSKKKQLADQIASVTKTRRTAIERDYDGQINEIKDKVRKVRVKKAKAKSEKVAKRIKKETSGLVEEKQHYREEIKEVYAASQMPSVLNKDFFHAICQPTGIRDILMILLTFAFVLLIFPCGIYFLLLPKKIIWLVLIYVVTIPFFGWLYFMLYKKIKESHPAESAKIHELRGQMKETRKKIRKMESGIRKDKDESMYGLEKFEQELGGLSGEIEEITGKKKEALKKFENETQKAIANSLTQEAAKELAPLQARHEEMTKEQDGIRERLKQLAALFTDRYSGYLGKENMTIEKLDEMARIMEAGEAATIGEAISILQKKSAP